MLMKFLLRRIFSTYCANGIPRCLEKVAQANKDLNAVRIFCDGRELLLPQLHTQSIGGFFACTLLEQGSTVSHHMGARGFIAPQVPASNTY
jgi:hypothetical protein